MSTLASPGMDADQDYIPNTDLGAGFYEIDSELIRIRPEQRRATDVHGQASSTGYYVDRPLGTSTRAAHTTGATVTRVSDPASGGGGGGGGGVTVEVPPAAPVSVTNIVAAGATISGGTATLPLAFQRIGPYRVTYQTPNINTGVDVGAIPAGAIVLRVFGKAVTAWAANGSGPEMRLGIAATVSGGTQSLYTSENVDTGPQTFGVDAEYDQSPSFTRYPIGFMNEAGTIHVECFDEDDGSLPTAGSADIYALIAVPAS